MGTFRGVPIRLHLSIPVGCAVFSGFQFVPAFWLAFTFLVLAHEIGHAIVVSAYRYRALSIDVTGFGGLCRWSGHANGFERSVIAWGGVLAQLVILLLTLLLIAFFGTPPNPHVSQMAYAFLRSDLILIGLNLIPVPPLDGAEAWKVFRHGRFQQWWAAMRYRIRKPFPRKPSKGSVIDIGQARKKRQKETQGSTEKTSPNPLADELLRLSKEAAQARKKREEN